LANLRAAKFRQVTGRFPSQVTPRLPICLPASRGGHADPANKSRQLCTKARSKTPIRSRLLHWKNQMLSDLL
jgi:hypothetical protein